MTPAWVTDALDERARQEAEWGVQRRQDGTGYTIDRNRAKVAKTACKIAEAGGGATWYAMLLEEVYEALAESDVVELRNELVQVAAVCGAWIEDIDSREEVHSGSDDEG